VIHEARFSLQKKGVDLPYKQEQSVR